MPKRNGISVKQVANDLKQSPQTIMLWIRGGTCPFGFAVKNPNSHNYTYIIVEKLYRQYVDMPQAVQA